MAVSSRGRRGPFHRGDIVVLPKYGAVALPEGTAERIKEWTAGEEAREQEKEALVGELSQVLRAHGRDPTPIREAMGG